jgi:hypothetical protein
LAAAAWPQRHWQRQLGHNSQNGGGGGGGNDESNSHNEGFRVAAAASAATEAIRTMEALGRRLRQRRNNSQKKGFGILFLSKYVLCLNMSK